MTVIGTKNGGTVKDLLVWLYVYHLAKCRSRYDINKEYVFVMFSGRNRCPGT